jgi:FkbM family methyltransferase
MHPQAAESSDLSAVFNNPFGIQNFWRYHQDEFVFNGDNCTLKDLDFKLPVREMGLFHVPLRIYFAERKNYKISFVNGEVNIRIDDLEFTLPFPNGIFEVLEVFRDKCYAGFDLRSGVVVDIGTYIGDSAIYFAKQGAKHVEAFEPVPQLHELACKNVKKNNYADKVEVRNIAVSDKKRIDTVNVNPYFPSLSSMVQKNNLTYPCSVRTKPLSDIIAELNDVALLKMDCEGLEYTLIPHAYKKNALSHVHQLCLEVHGSPQPIIHILRKAMFKITYTNNGPNFLLCAKK